MAAIELDQCPSTYRPYVPQPDIIAERQIRHVEECARTPSLNRADLHLHGGLTRPAGSAQPPMPQRTQVHRHGRRGIRKDLLQGLRYPLGSLIDFIPPLPRLKSQPMFIARAVPRLLLGATFGHMHFYKGEYCVVSLGDYGRVANSPTPVAPYGTRS